MNNKYIVNHYIFAEQQRELDMTVQINDLSQISDFIVDDSYIFNTTFSFFRENKTPSVRYSIKGDLKLVCQDSLDEFDFNIDITDVFAIVKDDRLLKNDIYEPFICETETLDLRDIIKENILLELPLVPKKDSSSCKINQKHSYYDSGESFVDKKVNPFEALKDLKF